MHGFVTSCICRLLGGEDDANHQDVGPLARLDCK